MAGCLGWSLGWGNHQGAWPLLGGSLRGQMGSLSLGGPSLGPGHQGAPCGARCMMGHCSLQDTLQASSVLEAHNLLVALPLPSQGAGLDDPQVGPWGLRVHLCLAPGVPSLEEGSPGPGEGSPVEGSRGEVRSPGVGSQGGEGSLAAAGGIQGSHVRRVGDRGPACTCGEGGPSVVGPGNPGGHWGPDCPLNYSCWGHCLHWPHWPVAGAWIQLPPWVGGVRTGLGRVGCLPWL